MENTDPSTIIESLRSILEPEQVTTDPDALEDFGQDWTRFYPPQPRGVVFPKDSDDVIRIVEWAAKNAVALVPSGGRTGLSAGAVATCGEIVVSFKKMNKIEAFDAVDQTVQCQPGVITEKLQEFAKDKGLFFPVDFVSRGSSQIGGNVATNAGGINVIRYGLIRNWIVGLEVVTGKAEKLSLNNGLIKNATGYDLRHLFIGSEGTLGFITKIWVRLTSPPKTSSVIVLGLDSLDAVMKVFGHFQGLTLNAFEFFDERALQKVLAATQLKRPFESETPFYLLVEAENQDEATTEKILSIFETCLENGWVSDGIVSQSEVQAKQLWRLREDISESLAPETPYKNDISVRISSVPDFIADLEQVLEKNYPGFEVIWFGHIGDGNLHINILKPDHLNVQEFLKACHKVDDLVFSTVSKHGGSISAEHGIGLLKKDYLFYTRSPEEIEYIKAIKSIFDPKRILNPGKLL